jgi:hypothetical protein
MPRHPIGETAMTGAERLRRWRERKRQERPAKPAAGPSSQELAEARKEIERLREQLAAASKAAPDAKQRELVSKWMNAQLEIDRLRRQLDEARKAEPEQIAELRRHIRGLEAERARRDAAAKAAQTKAAKAALDPNSEAARQIKGLVTRVRNLTSELAHARAKHGHMTFATESLIAKALHPDATPSHKDREHALKAFNAWKVDSKAARRDRARTT